MRLDRLVELGKQFFPVGIIVVQQECRKFISADPEHGTVRKHMADERTCILYVSVACFVAERIIYCLQVVNVKDYDSEICYRTVFELVVYYVLGFLICRRIPYLRERILIRHAHVRTYLPAALDPLIDLDERVHDAGRNDKTHRIERRHRILGLQEDTKCHEKSRETDSQVVGSVTVRMLARPDKGVQTDDGIQTYLYVHDYLARQQRDVFSVRLKVVHDRNKEIYDEYYYLGYKQHPRRIPQNIAPDVLLIKEFPDVSNP